MYTLQPNAWPVTTANIIGASYIVHPTREMVQTGPRLGWISYRFGRSGGNGGQTESGKRWCGRGKGTIPSVPRNVRPAVECSPLHNKTTGRVRPHTIWYVTRVGARCAGRTRTANYDPFGARAHVKWNNKYRGTCDV